jgi:hypothetical protein
MHGLERLKGWREGGSESFSLTNLEACIIQERRHCRANSTENEAEWKTNKCEDNVISNKIQMQGVFKNQSVGECAI